MKVHGQGWVKNSFPRRISPKMEDILKFKLSVASGESGNENNALKSIRRFYQYYELVCT